MMNKLSLTLLIMLSLYCSIHSQSPEQAPLNRLSVSGSALINIAADQASFSFSVSGYGSSLRQAVENARNTISEISGKLFRLGLKPENLSTSSFVSGENMNGKAFLSSSKDFRTWMQVKVTIDNLALLDEIILTLSESSLEKITDITFDLKNIQEAKQMAREKAIEQAIKKAQRMAELAGVKLKKIVYLAEDRFPEHAPQFSNSVSYVLSEDKVSSSIYERTFKVQGSVSLVYEIE